VIRVLAPLSLLFVSVALLLVGNGMQGTLVALRSGLEGFGPLVTGALMAAYFAGFVGGCLCAPLVIRRVGHIRTFAVFAAIAAAVPLVHALVVSPPVWIALRLATGICIAGLYTVIESWLNDRAGNEQRGGVISVYRIIDLSATTVGLALLTTADPHGYPLFCIVAILLALALVPVGMTTAMQPMPVETIRLRLGRLYRLSPLGCVGCFGFGVASGAFWGLAPIYVQTGTGSDDAGMVAWLLGATMVGGAVAQWPVGLLSDRIDRRKVLAGALAAAAAAGVVMLLVHGTTPTAMIGAAFLFGATMVPIYSLCIAHANDFMTPADFVEASSGLLLINGVGATAGPFLAGWVASAAGPAYLFAFTASVHGAVALFAVWRMTRRPPAAERSTFVAVPRTSPVVFQLDPRSDETPPAEAPDEPSPGLSRTTPT